MTNRVGIFALLVVGAVLVEAQEDRPICPAIRCPSDRRCEFGHVRERGCPTCDCNPSPCERIDCPDGYICRVLNRRALCVRANNCRGLQECDLHCRFGYRTEAGCPICRCNDNPCERVRCPGECHVVRGRPVCRPAQQDTCETRRCPDGQRCQMMMRPCAADSTDCLPVPTCIASDGCPDEDCDRKCDFGYHRTAAGCKICECRNDPCDALRCRDGFECKRGDGTAECVPDSDECPELECDRNCDFGYHHTARGCKICECKRNPCETVLCRPGMICKVKEDHAECVQNSDGCPDEECDRKCDFGYHRTAAGCKICECRNDPCDALRCRDGFECKRGDGTAECVPDSDECPEVKCDHECVFGYHYTAAGCKTCECKRNPCETLQCEDGFECRKGTVRGECVRVTDCTKVECDTPCEFGHQITDDGCPTCDCKSDPCDKHTCEADQKCQLRRVRCFTQPCPPPVPVCTDACRKVECRMKCEAGYLKDRNGCDTCQCVSPCSRMHCSAGYKCQVHDGQASCVIDCRTPFCYRPCMHGYAKDSRGCKTCECNPNPCQTTTCGPNERCVPEKEDCDREPCKHVGVCKDVSTERTCPRLNCRCRFGHGEDNDGCPSCKCLDNPCDEMDCPNFCLPLPTSCDDVPCPMEGICISNSADFIRQLFRRFAGARRG